MNLKKFLEKCCEIKELCYSKEIFCEIENEEDEFWCLIRVAGHGAQYFKDFSFEILFTDAEDDENALDDLFKYVEIYDKHAVMKICFKRAYNICKEIKEKYK